MTATTSLQKVQAGAMTFGQQIGYTPEYVQLVKDTFARDASDNELQMFLEVCHQSKLNPFKKEIYFWKQSGKVIIHTGIDGYRLVADRTGRYAPGPPVKRTYDDAGNHVSSTAYVRKKVGTDWFIIEETAHMKEWTKDSPFWKGDKKSHQLDVTAERHALRKAFPASYASLDTSNPDGSPQIDAEPETPEQIETRKHLTDNLLKIGKLFANEDQLAALEATIAVSALPVLEERYSNALIKLREHTLSEIGTKLQGEAFSAFIVANFASGIEAAEADEFFTAIEKLKDVEPGEIVDTPPVATAAEEPAAAATEPVTAQAEAAPEVEAELVDSTPADNADAAEFEPVTIDEPLDNATENLRTEVQEMLSALPTGRQKDIMAGKPTVGKMDHDELTKLKARLGNDDIGF